MARLEASTDRTITCTRTRRRLYKRLHERLHECLHKSLYERLHGRLRERLCESLHECLYECLRRCLWECLHEGPQACLLNLLARASTIVHNIMCTSDLKLLHRHLSKRRQLPVSKILQNLYIRRLMDKTLHHLVAPLSTPGFNIENVACGIQLRGSTT